MTQHDLGRQNLNVIETNIQQLRNAAKCSDLKVGNIIDGSLLRKSMFQPRLAAFSLRDMALQVLDVFEMQAQSKNVETQLKIDQRILKASAVLCDEKRIQQVTLNLLNNALFEASSNSIISIDFYRKRAKNLQLQKEDFNDDQEAPYNNEEGAS